MKQPKFPCDSIPADPSQARLLGLYSQRREDLWMQRARVPGGRLSKEQWAVLAELIQSLTPGEPLHFTTRQDVELHSLSETAVPQAQRRLADVGLSCLGACGDTLRNITVCPCSGTACDRPDLLPLAMQLTAWLRSQPGAFALPRKFKISFSACPHGCGLPWINDLGFVAQPFEGRWRFSVVVAGSLGDKSATGIAYRRPLRVDEVFPFATASFRVFSVHGDREHRHKARLRHVRQRMGDEVFLELLDIEFQRALFESGWPDIRLTSPAENFTARARLRFPDGNIDLPQVQTLAMLAGRENLRVRIGYHHELNVYAHDDLTLQTTLRESGFERYAQSAPRVVACPGSRWCNRALTATHSLAAAVRKKLEGRVQKDILIAISGCQNHCSHSAIADVGAFGVLGGASSSRTELWNVLAGGECGLGPGLAQPAAQRLGLEEAAETIVKLATQSPPSRLADGSTFDAKQSI